MESGSDHYQIHAPRQVKAGCKKQNVESSREANAERKNKLTTHLCTKARKRGKKKQPISKYGEHQITKEENKKEEAVDNHSLH